MKKLPLFICLLSMIPSLYAEESIEAPQFSSEQLELIRKSLIRPETPEEAAAKIPAVPTISGSRSVADEAYRKKDYKTAIKHYEALATGGDGEASLILGTMHEEGRGTDKDQARAHAWYKTAGDTHSDDGAGSQLAESLEYDSLSTEELAKAKEIYKELNPNKKITEANPESKKYGRSEKRKYTKSVLTNYKRKPKYLESSSKSDNAAPAFSESITTSLVTNRTYKVKTVESPQSNAISSIVVITPEKFNRDTQNQLSKTKDVEHYEPVKINRQNSSR
jgi:hypothetical protein